MIDQQEIEHRNAIVVRLTALCCTGILDVRLIENAIGLINSLSCDREIFKEQARAAGVELKAERDTSAALRKTIERVTRKLEKAKAKSRKRREMLREACGAHLDDTFNSLLSYISDLRERHKHLRTTIIRAQDAIPDVRWEEDVNREQIISAISAMNERSSAWLSVVSALDEYVPNWRTGDSETGELLAVEAIRKLATKAAVEKAIKTPADSVDIPDGWFKVEPLSFIDRGKCYDFILADGKQVNGCHGSNCPTNITAFRLSNNGRNALSES